MAGDTSTFIREAQRAVDGLGIGQSTGVPARRPHVAFVSRARFPTGYKVTSDFGTHRNLTADQAIDALVDAQRRHAQRQSNPVADMWGKYCG